MEEAPTVLVLDDDPGVRSSMERLLKIYGYGAVSVSTLDEAQDVLKTTPVQALILDVGLQGPGTGIDLLMSIRQRPEFNKAQVLIFTGGVLSDKEEATITANRAFLFYKPEGFDTLVKFLDTLTGRDRPN